MCHQAFLFVHHLKASSNSSPVKILSVFSFFFDFLSISISSVKNQIQITTKPNIQRPLRYPNTNTRHTIEIVKNKWEGLKNVPSFSDSSYSIILSISSFNSSRNLSISLFFIIHILTFI